MKKILIAIVLVYLFVGFRPPEGMSKFPSASLSFIEQEVTETIMSHMGK